MLMGRLSGIKRAQVGTLGLVACLAAAPLRFAGAQELIPSAGPGGSVRLFNGDTAILEATDNRKDLPCTVTPAKPAVGFDLKFHAGYEVNVPLKELAGPENQLTMVFRVKRVDAGDEGTYLSQRTYVPGIDADEGGQATLQGWFNLGEGKYHIDWLMRDRAERMCSYHWDTEASLPAKDKQMALNITPGAVQVLDPEIYKPEAPVKREQADAPVNIKVMMNFAPQDSTSAALQPIDTSALLSILRSIAREPAFAAFRSSSTTCRNSAFFTGRMARRKSTFRPWVMP